MISVSQLFGVLGLMGPCSAATIFRSMPWSVEIVTLDLAFN